MNPKKIILTTLTAVVAAFTLNLTAQDAGEGFAKRIRITASGYNGSGLENVPALVRLSPEKIEGFSYDDFALPNGGDLRFTTADGTPLAHEIDTWNKDGESLVWVKVPSMAKDVKIIAYFGNESPWAVDAKDVWSDYIGVYHMSETCDTETAATTLAMSSTGKYNAEPQSSRSTASEMVSTTGKIGLGRVNISKNGDTSRNALTIPNTDAEACDGVFTVSGWFYAKGLNGGAARIIARKNNHNASNGWELGFNGGTTSTLFYRGGGSTYVSKDCNPALSSGWSFLTLVYNDTLAILYQNGAKLAEGTFGRAGDNGLGISFGNNPNCSEASFYGSYDEARLSKGAMSAERVKFDYDTVAGTIFTYGGVESNVSVTLTITNDDTKQTYVATVDGVPVTSGAKVGQNSEAVIVATPVEGYIYASAPEGWTLKDGSITKVETIVEDTVITIPDAESAASITFTLTTETCENGLITGNADEYQAGETATLTAVAEEGYEFVQWTGDASGAENPLEITMDANKTIGAIFKTFSYIKNGSFEYGAKKTNGEDVPYGTSTADFTRPTGWTGGTYVYRGTETERRGDQKLLWDGSGLDKNTYGFVRDGWYCLAIEGTAPLSTEITVDKGGRYELTLWKTVKFMQQWSADVYLYLDDQRVCKITMPGSYSGYPHATGWNKQTVSLNLRPGTYTLKLQGETAGFVMIFDDLSLVLKEEIPLHSVTITSADSQTYTATVGGSPIGDTVFEGEVVTITATPAADYAYPSAPEGWTLKNGSITKDVTIVGDTAIVIPNAESTATVVFTLATETCENGSITGKTGEYSAGETATLTAVAEEGYEFVQWTGDASGAENPLEITMDANKTVGAIFKKFSYIKNGSFEYGVKKTNGEDVPYGTNTKDFTRPTGWTGGTYVYRGTETERRGDQKLLWDGSGRPDPGYGFVCDGWYCVAIEGTAPLSTEIAIDRHGRYELTLWKTVKFMQQWSADVYLYLDDQRVCKITMPESYSKYPHGSGWNKQTVMLNLLPGDHTLKLQGETEGFVMLFDDLSLIYDQPLEPGDADLLTVSDYDGDTALDATVNLPNSGRYQFSCRYLRRGDNANYDQDAVLKIDDTVVATVPTTSEKSAWQTFETERFSLKKGEHRIVIEGSSGKQSVLKLDQLRLSFRGAGGVIFMIY